MSFSPWLLLLFAFASLIRIIQVRELGWKYMMLAGLMVEELYYAFFLEAVLWRSVYLAFCAEERRPLVNEKGASHVPHRPNALRTSRDPGRGGHLHRRLLGVWAIFAVTLVVTTVVAITVRSRERRTERGATLPP